MTKSRAAAVACIGFLVLVAGRARPGQPAATGAPDPAKVAEAGTKSLERLETTPASWQAETRVSGAAGSFVLRVLRAGDRRKTALLVRTGQGLVEGMRLIERDGLSYLLEGGRPRGKYRPHEAPFSVPTLRLFLRAGEVSFVSDPGVLQAARFRGMEGPVAEYRQDLDAQGKALVEGLIGSAKKLRQQMPDAKVPPELQRQLAELKAMLQHGLPLRVDVRTGMVVESGGPKLPTTFRDFRWRPDAGDADFDVGSHAWPDHTSDPTEGTDLNDLVMFGHCAAWRAGMGAKDTDTCLLNLKTGRLRRVPFRGAISSPGCFLKPRTRVVVSGFGADPGDALALYEVDLRTGANRRLGGPTLRGRFALMPALSPDGKTLAVLTKDPARLGLESQVCLIDVKTGRARDLGKPLDTAFLSWLPDGQGLVLITRKYRSMDEPADATVARMDLQGRITAIRPGNHPVVLPGGKRILFEDAARAWQTCELDGKNVKLLGGGMSGHSFPSPCPDGRRIMWMLYEKGRGPRPVVYDVVSGKTRPATSLPGLWVTPAWR